MPSDCLLGILNTETNKKKFFLIESKEWNILDSWWDISSQEMVSHAKSEQNQRILQLIFEYESNDNSDEDEIYEDSIY